MVYSHSSCLEYKLLLNCNRTLFSQNTKFRMHFQSCDKTVFMKGISRCCNNRVQPFLPSLFKESGYLFISLLFAKATCTRTIFSLKLKMKLLIVGESLVWICHRMFRRKNYIISDLKIKIEYIERELVKYNDFILHKNASISLGALIIFYASALLGIFGDVTKIDTTGASERTARQDKLTVNGMPA